MDLTSWPGKNILNTYAILSFASPHVESHLGHFGFMSPFLWYIILPLLVFISLDQMYMRSNPYCIWQECVPVIISDQTELPFQNVIDYSQISIKWPSSRIGPELLQYLESIPGGNAASSSTHNTLAVIYF